MIKTIVTIPHWTAPPTEAYDEFLTGLNALIAAGKYTNQVNQTVDPSTGTKTIERWDWADTESAQAYITLSDEKFGPYEPGMQSQIVTQ